MRQIDYELDVIEQLGFPGYFLVLARHRRVLPRARHLLPGPGERGEQRGLLRARGHQGRRGRARAAVRAVPLARARRPARHRPRHRAPAARGGDPVRLREVRARPRRAGRERHHLPAALGAARDGEGRGPLARSGRRADQLDRPVAVDATARSTTSVRATTRRRFPSSRSSSRTQVLDFPRHLGIHSGGMVMADRPLVEFCPVEWARMEDRSVLQWDKDDCAAAGPGEVRPARPRDAHDAAPRGRPRPRARRRRGRPRHHPPGARGLRPAVRGRHHRRVPGGEPGADGHAAAPAAARPSTTSWWRSRSSGPARSRAGRCTRTCGAATARRRSPTRIRSSSRACGRRSACRCSRSSSCRWRSTRPGSAPAKPTSCARRWGRSGPRRAWRAMRDRLMAGMAERGITGDDGRGDRAQARGVRDFGFPESHSVSFAYLVYSSSWIKLHYPAEFACALLNAQPMGFYSPHTIVRDARRHGVEVLGPVRRRVAPRLHARAAHVEAGPIGHAAARLARRPVDPRGADRACATCAGSRRAARPHRRRAGA